LRQPPIAAIRRKKPRHRRLMPHVARSLVRCQGECLACRWLNPASSAT